jgi:hypothetical protein
MITIEHVRAFLHAQDTTHVWKVLEWINEQTFIDGRMKGASEVYHYYRAALTEDVRATALDTIWGAIWAETQRVTMTWWDQDKNEHLWYGGAEFASAKSNARFEWVRVRDMNWRSPLSMPKRIVVSHEAALYGLPKALRWDFGARLAACAEHIIRKTAPIGTGNPHADESAAIFRAVQSPEWKFATDRRRNIDERIEAFAKRTPEGDAMATFERWAMEEYARFCLGFLLGPARGSTSHLPPERPLPACQAMHDQTKQGAA